MAEHKPLEPNQWDGVLGELRDTICRGIERIATRDVMAFLGLPESEAKHLRSLMRSHGWSGPRAIRIPDANGKFSVVSGYQRSTRALVHKQDAELHEEGDEEHEEQGYDTNLPAKLERTTRLSLRELQRILKLKLDPKDGNQLRAKVAAAGIAINAQLRADEARLKAKVRTDTLDRLLKIVEQQKQKLLDDE